MATPATRRELALLGVLPPHLWILLVAVEYEGVTLPGKTQAGQKGSGRYHEYYLLIGVSGSARSFLTGMTLVLTTVYRLDSTEFITDPLVWV
jgi:hypothetical protein